MTIPRFPSVPPGFNPAELVALITSIREHLGNAEALLIESEKSRVEYIEVIGALERVTGAQEAYYRESDALIARLLGERKSKSSGRRPGRPVKVEDLAELQQTFQVARRELQQFRKLALCYTATIEHGQIAAKLASEMPELSARLNQLGLMGEWFEGSPFDRTLDELAADLVSKENPKHPSPSTVVDYARRRPETLQKRRTEKRRR
jgi:hypothetical protein